MENNISFDLNDFGPELVNANYSNLELSEAEKLPIVYKARAIMINSDNKVIMTFIPSISQIGTPGGKIEKGETVEQALVRECKEETGYNIDIISQLGYGKLYRETYISIAFIFIVRTVGDPESLSLEQDELDDGQELIVLSMDEAIEKTKDSQFTRLYLEAGKKYFEDFKK